MHCPTYGATRSRSPLSTTSLRRRLGAAAAGSADEAEVDGADDAEDMDAEACAAAARASGRAVLLVRVFMVSVSR